MTLPLNHKGEWCNFKPILCQEGFCSECTIPKIKTKTELKEDLYNFKDGFNYCLKNGNLDMALDYAESIVYILRKLNKKGVKRK